jgi:hypothetical protein
MKQDMSNIIMNRIIANLTRGLPPCDTLPTELSTGWYPNEYACYPINAEKEADKEIYGYVENRFNHGDYIYADGVYIVHGAGARYIKKVALQ